MFEKIDKLFSSPLGREMFEKAVRTMERHGMTAKLREGVMIGLSGGADSVFLCLLMHKYRKCYAPDMKVLAVHINHMIRGDEADRDEKFSRELAESLGFEFASRRINIPLICAERGKGCEETAREERYSAFRDILSGRNDISIIATAHNLSDNVETVLFNMVRGTGIRGATGIAPIRGDGIVRPLLDISGKDIRLALDEYKIEYVCDSTNESVEYSRNYLRRDVLPRLQRINPQYESAVSSFASSLAESLDFIRTSCRDVLDEANSKSVSLGLLRELHPAVFAIFISDFAAFNGARRPDRRQIAAIFGLLAGDNFKYSLGGFDFVCERGRCYFSPKSNKERSADMLLELHRGSNALPGYSAVIWLGDREDAPSLNVYKYSIQADLSSAIINGSLYVRFRRSGDKYFYGGMTHKLKKVFNDRGIPLSHRDLIPVVCDDSGIVWVPGMGVRDDLAPEKGEKLLISFSVPYGDDGEGLYTALKET